MKELKTTQVTCSTWSWMHLSSWDGQGELLATRRLPLNEVFLISAVGNTDSIRNSMMECLVIYCRENIVQIRLLLSFFLRTDFLWADDAKYLCSYWRCDVPDCIPWANHLNNEVHIFWYHAFLNNLCYYTSIIQKTTNLFWPFKWNSLK